MSFWRPFCAALASLVLLSSGPASAAAAATVEALPRAVAASEEAALELHDQVREAGFAARIRPRQAEGEGWRYEVLLGGFSSADEAAVSAARLTVATGLKPSVGR